jgi:hypothetical protein
VLVAPLHAALWTTRVQRHALWIVPFKPLSVLWMTQSHEMV